LEMGHEYGVNNKFCWRTCHQGDGRPSLWVIFRDYCCKKGSVGAPHQTFPKDQDFFRTGRVYEVRWEPMMVRLNGE
jgi:hypothetical protein